MRDVSFGEFFAKSIVIQPRQAHALGKESHSLA
jgi:hypothetical protein